MFFIKRAAEGCRACNLDGDKPNRLAKGGSPNSDGG